MRRSVAGVVQPGRQRLPLVDVRRLAVQAGLPHPVPDGQLAPAAVDGDHAGGHGVARRDGGADPRPPARAGNAGRRPAGLVRAPARRQSVASTAAIPPAGSGPPTATRPSPVGGDASARRR